jgi:hypothetical protein
MNVLLLLLLVVVVVVVVVLVLSLLSLATGYLPGTSLEPAVTSTAQA